jgi:hypothetical protein
MLHKFVLFHDANIVSCVYVCVCMCVCVPYMYVLRTHLSDMKYSIVFNKTTVDFRHVTKGLMHVIMLQIY